MPIELISEFSQLEWEGANWDIFVLTWLLNWRKKIVQEKRNKTS